MAQGDFPTFEEWRSLSEDQRNYLVWQALSDTKKMSQRFASKRVETIVYTMVALILSGFIMGITNLLYLKK